MFYKTFIYALEYLNVSFNILNGEVPTGGVLGNASGLVVTGNSKLRGVFLNCIYHNAPSKEMCPRTLSANCKGPRTLNLDQRLNIMIDVASTLHYLHHECEQSIIHCDLKPRNVLNDDMIAHVSDFCIARLLSTINGTTSKQTSIIGIKGTIGYAPPEYGMGSEVSMNSDMYSFEVLLLEMLTGRRPTDQIFEDGPNMHNFVENSYPDNLFHILDPSLVPKPEEATIQEENSQNLTPTVANYLVSLLKIGLACSVESPKERMNVVDVTRELRKIRKAFLTGKINGILLNSLHITREQM
ncbi:putative LRR receptor-like serine/threonine-protein kinase [Glycine max]|nr:putative LRR receptor-like serine/threonine-protein kinase [Glycine max]